MLLPYTAPRCPLSLLWPWKYLPYFMSGTLWHSVLGLAGMELIFSTAAHKMLCFGSVTKTVLISTRASAVAERCFPASRPSLFPTLPPQPGAWGAQGAGHTQLLPADQGDIPYRVTSSSAIKSWWGEFPRRPLFRGWLPVRQLAVIAFCIICSLLLFFIFFFLFIFF